MKLWMVRGGKGGRHQEEALEDGYACIGYYEMPDLKKASTRDEMVRLIQSTNPQTGKKRATNLASQVFAFAHRIGQGDLITMPLRTKPQIAIGKVTGPYRYRTDLGDLHHTIPVEWIAPDVPRTMFGKDLLYSLGAFMTVCEVRRNQALERVQAILEGKVDPFLGPGSPAGEAETAEAEAPPDIEQLAQDQLLSHVESVFKGHELSRLVNAVLEAQGYITQQSLPGPDGGVDILAGRGSLGLDGPRLCVQVKSSASPVDVNVLRALQGTMANFKADQGLLVSWGGFGKGVEKEARHSFFTVRLWNAGNLVDAVLASYEKLPEELQKELPLKRIWTLVTEE